MSRIVLLTCALLLSSCTSSHGPVRPWEPPASSTAIATPPDVRARGEAVDWGVALSGGGVRSALFSVGVLKALYDAGVLDEADAISSVSGGGYASYWLYRSQLRAPVGSRFGSRVLDDSVFATSVCELQSRGNFHTYPEIAASLPGSLVFDRYQRSIQSTFGYEDSTAPDLPLDAAGQLIERGDAPFFILNATYYKSSAPRLHRGLELTPAYIGSPSRGYVPVTQQTPGVPGWAEAVTAAAAAKAPLRHPIRNFFGGASASADTIWDGGYHENLAALALVRRRIPNIVIVDAEHDPDYQFEGYERLRHLLRDEGVELAVPLIDQFIGETKIGDQPRRIEDRARFGSAPVAEGLVRFPDGKTSRLFYLKMSIPRSLLARLESSSDEYREGDRLDTRIDELLEDAPGALPSERCRVLAGHRELAVPARFVYRTSSYADWLASSRRLRALRLFGRGLRYEFPHMTTLDQSYYRDQTEALIGLGFLQAKDYRWPVGR